MVNRMRFSNGSIPVYMGLQHLPRYNRLGLWRALPILHQGEKGEVQLLFRQGVLGNI